MRRTRNRRPSRKRKRKCYGHKGKKCKTKKNEMHARVSRLIREVSRIYREEANLNGSRNCQGFIGQKESFSMDREAVKKLSRQNPEISIERVCDKICHDKKKKGLKTTIKKKKKSFNTRPSCSWPMASFKSCWSHH